MRNSDDETRTIYENLLSIYIAGNKVCLYDIALNKVEVICLCRNFEDLNSLNIEVKHSHKLSKLTKPWKGIENLHKHLT